MEENHLFFLMCQEMLLIGGFDQAENPQWVRNFVKITLQGAIAEYNQSPCDDCRLNGCDCKTDCKHK